MIQDVLRIVVVVRYNGGSKNHVIKRQRN